MTPSEKMYKIAAKCLKPIENQIYEADRQKVIEAIVVELEKIQDTNILHPEPCERQEFYLLGAGYIKMSIEKEA